MPIAAANYCWIDSPEREDPYLHVDVTPGAQSGLAGRCGHCDESRLDFKMIRNSASGERRTRPKTSPRVPLEMKAISLGLPVPILPALLTPRRTLTGLSRTHRGSKSIGQSA